MRPPRFETPADWRRLAVIDAHAAGEPLRVVTAGTPEIPGESMIARRRWASQHLDDLRRLLMLEPRGHADMYGCIVTPPASSDADFGVLFLHTEGWSTMCGHGIIGVVTVALETGMLEQVPTEVTIAIDTPAGRVAARAERDGGGRVRRVAFDNVPAFADALDAEVEVPGLGTVRYDLAFGGAFYAFVDAGPLGLALEPEQAATLIDAGRAIQRAITAARAVVHPGDEELGFLYGTVFVGADPTDQVHSRHACVFGDGQLDRSPTGTAVSARLAVLHARGELAIGDAITVTSILGTRFAGRAVDAARVGSLVAVVPEIAGSAWIVGRGELLAAPDDPLARGFLLR